MSNEKKRSGGLPGSSPSNKKVKVATANELNDMQDELRQTKRDTMKAKKVCINVGVGMGMGTNSDWWGKKEDKQEENEKKVCGKVMLWRGSSCNDVRRHLNFDRMQH